MKNPVKLPLYDATVNVRCKTSNGDPKPLLTASIVDLGGNKIRDLKGRVSQENANLTTFPLNMTENDVGNIVQCIASQGYGNDVMIWRKLAVYCECSEVGTQYGRKDICHPKSGQCTCKPNHGGHTCHEYKGQFKPKCNDKDSDNSGNKYEHGKEVNIPCDDQSIEIENCKWKKVNGGPSCSAGQEISGIWKKVYKMFSKKGCSLNFQMLELGHGGTYECELTPSKTGGKSHEGKLIQNKLHSTLFFLSIF